MSENTSLSTFIKDQSELSLIDVPPASKFLPYLSVAYGTSDVVIKRKAQSGDFVFGGTTCLGQSISLVMADYRGHATIWNDSNKSTDADMYHLRSQGKISDNVDWQNFVKQKLPKGCSLSSGVDLLVWLVDINAFAVFFMKNTLYGAFQAVYDASTGGRAIQITTRPEKAKRTGNIFYIIDVVALPRAVRGSAWNLPGISINADIDIPDDLYSDAKDKFSKPTSTVIEYESSGSERVR